MGGAWTVEDDARLKKLVEQYGKKWSAISEQFATSDDITTPRNRKECRERYVNHLDPTIRRDEWTEGEKAILRKALVQYNELNKTPWAKIAQLLPGRSADNVKNQYRQMLRDETKLMQKTTSSQTNNVAPDWTQEENDKLEKLCMKKPLDSWLWIASHFPKRTDLQCRQHWNTVLKPGLKKGKGRSKSKTNFGLGFKGTWTAEEDALLARLFDRFGPSWTQIAQNFPGRVGKQCRERYCNHVHHELNRGPWTKVEDEILLEAIKTHPNQWTFLGTLLHGGRLYLVIVQILSQDDQQI
ncbi:hypothetical protein Ae201684_005987 [Aphanomyces euteiches]|uniref:Uncharacterized protein n=1 Tax=Aphanomyces euteiches TaxID=100861 RepID=A0A6G0XCT0_9STRA|nr:hypothetical protein Ae201684_005987 [Aphanomyces euteiches]